jgi:hypothetical protein
MKISMTNNESNAEDHKGKIVFPKNLECLLYFRGQGLSSYLIEQ